MTRRTTRERKIAKARELRDEGLTYEAIGRVLGVSGPCISNWLNPQMAREKRQRDNLKRRAAKREWERDQRALCPKCGRAMQIGSTMPSHASKRCAKCVENEARERIERFIRLREEGLLNYEIEAQEGIEGAGNVVAVALGKAHLYGLTVPPSPYHHP